MKRFIAFFTLIAALPLQAADSFPLSVKSCNRTVTFQHPPQRAVSHDVNMTGMLLALGLRDRMAGYSGIPDDKRLDPQLRAALTGLPELAQRYPSLENLVAVDADLFFAGWNYGMHVGGPVTPQTLAAFDIPVYELSESCSRIMAQRAASLQDLYKDLTTLGAIFAVPERAKTLVDELKRRVARVTRALQQTRTQPRVFLYDSGADRPFTSGRLGMPQALIETAGGQNIMADVTASWTQVNWESVVERNPQIIVIVDYGPETWQQKRDFLLRQPALSTVDAIRDQRFVVLSYTAATPSVQNAEAIEKLAAAFHPDTFAKGRP